MILFLYRNEKQRWEWNPNLITELPRTGLKRVVWRSTMDGRTKDLKLNVNNLLNHSMIDDV